jgi:hypothetical protein
VILLDIYDLVLDSKDAAFAKRIAEIRSKSIDELYLDEISSAKGDFSLCVLFEEIINNDRINDKENVMEAYMKKHNQYYNGLPRLNLPEKEGF